jgi:hypothetical protein
MLLFSDNMCYTIVISYHSCIYYEEIISIFRGDKDMLFYVQIKVMTFVQSSRIIIFGNTSATTITSPQITFLSRIEAMIVLSRNVFIFCQDILSYFEITLLSYISFYICYKELRAFVISQTDSLLVVAIPLQQFRASLPAIVGNR